MLALQRILGRQTTQRMVADMLLARQQIARETSGLDQGATVNQGLSGYDNNIHAGLQNLDSAWHNLMVAIGGPEGESFARLLNMIAGVVSGITNQVNKLTTSTPLWCHRQQSCERQRARDDKIARGPRDTVRRVAVLRAGVRPEL